MVNEKNVVSHLCICLSFLFFYFLPRKSFFI